MSHVLTYLIRAWTLSTAVSTDFEKVTTHVLGSLINFGELDLAEDFLRFVPIGSWSTYLRGRLLLLRGEYALAAKQFQKGAFSLGIYPSL